MIRNRNVSVRRSESSFGLPLGRFLWFGAAGLMCFGTVFGFCAAAHAEGWPTYRHDIARKGASMEVVRPPLSEAWVFKPQHAPKPAWPLPVREIPRNHDDDAYHAVIGDKTVFFGTSVDDTVYAIDVASGRVRWAFTAEGPVRFAPTLYEGKLLFGSDDGHVYCLRSEGGGLVWKFRAGPTDEKLLGNGRMISRWPVRTSVLVDDQTVYLGAGVFPYEGIYICSLRADDGSVIWKNDTIGDRSHDLEYGGISPQGYLVASKGILYVPSGRAMPAAFDRETGRFLYYRTLNKQGGTWTLLDGDRLITGVGRAVDPIKVALDPRTGVLKGDVYGRFAGTDMVTTEEIVYLLNGEGVYAIERGREFPADRERDIPVELSQLGKRLQELRRQEAEAEEERVADIRRQIEAITGEIALVSEEKKNLKKSICRWEYAADDLQCLIKSDEVVFAGGEGRIIAMDAATGLKIWEYKVEGTVCGLAAANGALVVSTDTGYVYCLVEKTAGQGAEIALEHEREPYRRDQLSAIYEETAERILETVDSRKGWCLVLDCGRGRLAYELAKRSDFQILGLETDPNELAAAREGLRAAGMLGARVTVEPWELDSLPDYFADSNRFRWHVSGWPYQTCTGRGVSSPEAVRGGCPLQALDGCERER